MLNKGTFLGVAAAVVLSTFGVAASAGPKAPGKKPAAGKVSNAMSAQAAAEIKVKLTTGSAPEIREALESVRQAGPGAVQVAPAVEELLARGATSELSILAMQALSTLGDPTASAAIRPYVRHRIVDVRRAAVKALRKTGGPEAVEALRQALSDPDAVVRGNAATALGELKATAALEDLFAALDHKINEAAGAIGQICAPSTCERFTGKLGTIAFDVMTSGLDPILFRPSSEISDDEKLKLVARIRGLATPEAAKYLKDVQSRLAGGSPAIRQAIGDAVTATGGGNNAGGQP
jgi:HEAT repeat protein